MKFGALVVCAIAGIAMGIATGPAQAQSQTTKPPSVVQQQQSCSVCTNNYVCSVAKPGKDKAECEQGFKACMANCKN